MTEEETKKLADTYKIQKDVYENDMNQWKNYLLVSITSLVIFIGISFLNEEIWYKQFELYLIDFIFGWFIWFCMIQYSYYSRLRSDFANRYTLAQSYYSVISNEKNDVIKRDLLNKASNVLCVKCDLDYRNFFRY